MVAIFDKGLRNKHDIRRGVVLWEAHKTDGRIIVCCILSLVEPAHLSSYLRGFLDFMHSFECNQANLG